MFVKCVVCVTWDDELRTMKIAIPSVSFNREQLDAFQRLFEAYSLFSKPMKSKPLLRIYDRKNIELISGKLGGEAPNKSRQHFRFQSLYFWWVYWLLLRKSFNVSCDKLLFINQTKSKPLRCRILMFN